MNKKQTFPQYVPGIPIKRNNPLVDPQQSMCPHIKKVIQIKEDENGKEYISDEELYTPNGHDYPEYEYLIRLFMKEHKLKELK